MRKSHLQRLCYIVRQKIRRTDLSLRRAEAEQEIAVIRPAHYPQNVFGLLGAEIWAKDTALFKAGPAGARNRKPIEEKESHRWLESWRKADALHHRLGRRHRVVSVADREGDIYEAFALCLESKAERGGRAD